MPKAYKDMTAEEQKEWFNRRVRYRGETLPVRDLKRLLTEAIRDTIDETLVSLLEGSDAQFTLTQKDV